MSLFTTTATATSTSTTTTTTITTTITIPTTTTFIDWRVVEPSEMEMTHDNHTHKKSINITKYDEEVWQDLPQVCRVSPRLNLICHTSAKIIMLRLNSYQDHRNAHDTHPGRKSQVFSDNLTHWHQTCLSVCCVGVRKFPCITAS